MTLWREKCFPALACGLWIAFLFLDITRSFDTTALKFCGVGLCFLMALTGLRSPDGRLVATALAFTVAADWFLLVRNDHYEIGISLFLVVQLLYAYRLSRFFRLRERRSPGLWIHGITLVFGCLFLFAWKNPLIVLSLVYFSNLALNTAEALSLGQDARRFAWGLLLFMGCDLCVAGWNLGLFPALTRVGMWFFYLPSQVLIVLSCRADAPKAHSRKESP